MKKKVIQDRKNNMNKGKKKKQKNLETEKETTSGLVSLECGRQKNRVRSNSKRPLAPYKATGLHFQVKKMHLR